MATIRENATYTHVIHLYGNGGTVPKNSVSNYRSTNDASVSVATTIPSGTPTRSGYTFIGYSRAKASNPVDRHPGDSMSASFSRTVTSTRMEDDGNYHEYAQDKTVNSNIYAQWRLNAWNVTYNAGGGSGAPSAQTKEQGVNLTLSTAVPTWAGHSFAKWNTSPSGTGTDYNPGDTYTADADLTLYAIWLTDEYVVSFNANGGSDAPESQTKLYGENLTLTDDIPTRTGYDFIGWNTAADGSGANYQPGEDYTANAAVTLYAVWSRTFFLISYNANGHGDAPAAQSKEYGDSVIIAAAPTAPAGCALVEWNTAADMTVTSYDPADVYTADADLTLYAIWLEGVYTVTFDADGGTVDPLTKTVLAGHKYGALPVPVKAGETFYGWFIGDLLVTANSIVELEDDETLTASWEIRSSMRTMGTDGQLHTGALYVKGSDGVMHMAIAYVKGSDGQMHVNG